MRLEEAAGAEKTAETRRKTGGLDWEELERRRGERG
jgi:hypothetical protein